MTPLLLGIALGLLVALIPSVFFYSRHLRAMAETASTRERMTFLENQLA